MNLKHVLLIAAIALVSGAVLAQTKTTVITGNSQPAHKWESFCADAVSSGVKSPGIDSANDPAGWNVVLRRYGEGGWEPFQMMGSATSITGVCFRRPLQ